VAGQTEAGCRFRPHERLHRPEEFAAVMASPLRLRSACFELRYRKIDGREAGSPGGARIGLIIPKRLVRRAVMRNLLKRLVREAFRQTSGSLPAVDAVLRLVKPPLPATGKVDQAMRQVWRHSIDELLAGLAR
jgi:ribonuclease P protein component